MKAHHAALLGLAGSWLAACSSNAPQPDRPMPFHVALAPLGQAEVLDEPQSGDLSFSFDEGLIQRMNEALELELEEICFAIATPLAPGSPAPEGLSDELSGYLAAASACGADLLLTFRLRHEQVVHEQINPFLHTAAPFSWLPGPQVWAVPDRKYTTNCSLSVFAYDVSRYQQSAGGQSIGDRRWYFTHTAALNELYSNYFERAGGNLHYYLPGLVVPTMFLELEKDEFERELMQDAVDDLAQILARDIQNRRVDLVRNEHQYSFFLDEDRTRVERVGEGQARVTFSLSHKHGLSTNEPRELRLAADCGDRPALEEVLGWREVEAARAERDAPSGYARYTFTRLVDISPRSRHLGLRVCVGSGPRVWRSFSLALPPLDTDD